MNNSLDNKKLTKKLAILSSIADLLSFSYFLWFPIAIYYSGLVIGQLTEPSYIFTTYMIVLVILLRQSVIILDKHCDKLFFELLDK